MLRKPGETTPGQLESPVWEPSTAQLNYLSALEDAIEANEPYSDRALAAKLKMSRTTIWEWKHDPRFQRWLKGELDQTSEHLWPLILRKHELLAMRGSVKSAEFIARVRFAAAKLAAGNAPGDANNGGDPTLNYKVILMVPRPPALDGDEQSHG